MSAPDSATTFRGLPAPTDPGFNAAVKELLETMAGQRGPAEDRVVTLRDLADASLVRYLNDQDVSVTRPDEANPPQDVPEPPYDLELITVDDATRINAFNHHLTWTLPDDNTISGTEIWVAVGTDSRTSAAKVGIVTYPQHEYIYQNFDITEHHYYWIRTFNWAGNYSTWEPSAMAGGYLVTKTGSIKASIDKIMSTLKGEAPATWLVGTHYDVGEQVSHVCTDGQTRTYVCVEHGTGEEPDGTTAQKAHWNRMGILTTGEVDGVACVGIDGNMVVDGTIVTRNLDADCITADKIAADAIEADHISVGAKAEISPELPSDANLLMYMPMDDGLVPFTAAGLFIDASGHLAHLAPNRSVSYTQSPVSTTDYPGIVGNGAGISNGLGFTVPAATAAILLPVATSGEYYTLSLWHKRVESYTHTADWQILLNGWGDTNRGIYSYYHELGCYSAITTPTFQTFGWTVPDGEWHHLVFVFKNLVEVSLWVDGVFKSTVAYAGLACPNNFGNYVNDGSYAFPGILDEIRWYHAQLIEEEIRALYQFPAGLGKSSYPWGAIPEGADYGKMPKAWKHASDATKIDGGTIYTGTVVAGAIYTTSLSALSANLGTITAGLAKSSDGKIQVDFDNKWIKVWDASSVLRVHLGYIP